jgi:hypothetical protein
MAKKQGNEVVVANNRTSGDLEFTDSDATAAECLGVVIGGNAADRLTRAVMAYNQAARLAVEAGYLLLSVKSDVEHGEFANGIKALGLTQQRASELMRMAKFTTLLPDSQRAEMLALPKSKVLALASADPSVIEQMLEDGDMSDLDDMSVRGLRQRIRELEANGTDLVVQREKAEADLKAMEKKVRRAARDEEDQVVPLVVADVRAELAALIKKAELAITSLHPIGVEAVNLSAHEEATEWVRPTLRLGVAGLLSLRELIDGSIKSFTQAMGEHAGRLNSQPDALSFLDASEVKNIAEDWARLTATHQHEAALREHERAQAKPRGKGRPANAPEAPAKAKA